MGSKAQLKGKGLADAKEQIIEGIWEGKSLRKILRDAKGELPSRPTIFKWLNPNSEGYDSEFAYQYAHAHEESAHEDADKIADLAEELRNGDIEPAAARVIQDGLKWTASKKKPKKYGEKIDVTSGGKEVVQQVAIFKLPDNGRGDNYKPDEKESEE